MNWANIEIEPDARLNYENAFISIRFYSIRSFSSLIQQLRGNFSSNVPYIVQKLLMISIKISSQEVRSYVTSLVIVLSRN